MRKKELIANCPICTRVLLRELDPDSIGKFRLMCANPKCKKKIKVEIAKKTVIIVTPILIIIALLTAIYLSHFNTSSFALDPFLGN